MSQLIAKCKHYMGFLGRSDGKESACNAGDPDSIPGSRVPGEGSGYPLLYSYLEKFLDRGAWWAIVHEITESDTTEQLTLSHLLALYTYLHLITDPKCMKQKQN